MTTFGHMPVFAQIALVLAAGSIAALVVTLIVRIVWDGVAPPESRSWDHSWTITDDEGNKHRLRASGYATASTRKVWLPNEKPEDLVEFWADVLADKNESGLAKSIDKALADAEKSGAIRKKDPTDA